jgi:hypothetical protein
MLWRMEQKGFNHQAWHWMNVNIMPFIFHHGELRFSHNVFVSSKWTQRIKFLWASLHYLEPPYLLDNNYIVVPFLSRFCECISVCWKCAIIPHCHIPPRIAHVFRAARLLAMTKLSCGVCFITMGEALYWFTSHILCFQFYDVSP